MITLNIQDLEKREAMQEASRVRRVYYPSRSACKRQLAEALSLVGGRASYIRRVVKEPDMVEAAKRMLEGEKSWLLSKINLVPDCAEDALDEVSLRL